MHFLRHIREREIYYLGVIIKQMKKEMMQLRRLTGDTDASSEVMQQILRSQGLVK